MGNKVAKEFHAVKLSHGSLDGTEAELIAPEMVLRGKDSTTIVVQDIYQEGFDVTAGNKNNRQLMARHFINQDTKEALFQIDYKMVKKSQSSKQTNNKYTTRSIASDRHGSILYMDKKIVTSDGQKRTMIYKTCPVYPNQPAASTDDVIELDMKQKNLYLAAIVFDCRRQASQNAACAYLCLVTGPNKLDDTGFELQDLYRAIKIPKVQNGVLVVDMKGQAVGKSAMVRKGQCFDTTSSSSASSSSSCCYDEASTTSSSRVVTDSSRTSTTAFEIAPGADAVAVIAVASSLF